ncbi:lantibiotic immunity ABC transporter MutE/EpiE family permease subunit [Paenibacillus wulumuqiensis]|uniref:lantibiotic immunity ABC transporter MutE/EpiE family permease subunit n=1 Tax=Paenibacillus wulumuqiensis TaxID=1567107 RepID=UPI0006197C80|nr:lantibiotic immunity ABC transporter MutE/EpiE family permease subunit [Paenibacillus wulumuqiensis]
MIRCLRSEHLKFRRSFLRKLLLLIPVLNLLVSFLMNPIYIVTNTFNWWSIFFIPLTAALLCGLSHQKEQRAVNYNRIFSLPVSLSRIWYGKVFVIAIYMLLMLLVFEMLLFILQLIFPSAIRLSHTLLAVGLLWMGSLWQIPFCLWLSRRWGWIGTLVVHVMVGLVLGIYAAPLGWWWLNPWSWSIRMMCPVIGVHPNGVPLTAGDPLWNAAVIPAGLLLSVGFFLILLLWTGSVFAGQGRTAAVQREVS